MRSYRDEIRTVLEQPLILFLQTVTNSQETGLFLVSLHFPFDSCLELGKCSQSCQEGECNISVEIAEYWCSRTVAICIQYFK